MKKTLLFIAVIMIASVLLTAAAAVPKAQVWLEVINRTDGLVAIQLKGYGTKGELTQNYYLTTKSDWTNLFWIDRNTYKRTTWACGFKKGGDLLAIHNTRLNFTPCWGLPANMGEPSMEKVRYYYYYVYRNGLHVKVNFYSPLGIWWHYQY